MTDPKLRAAAALAAVALLGACGGDGTPSAKKSGNPAPAASNGATPGATGPAGSTAGTTHAPGTTAPGGQATTPRSGGGTSTSAQPGTTPSTAYSPTRIVLNGKLSRDCVKPGNPITLTVNARPDMRIIWDTSYSDGRSGAEYGGFERDGRTDAKGVYTKTWTVSPAASHGDAEIILAGVDEWGTGQNRIPFKVSLSC